MDPLMFLLTNFIIPILPSVAGGMIYDFGGRLISKQGKTLSKQDMKNIIMECLSEAGLVKDKENISNKMSEPETLHALIGVFNSSQDTNLAIISDGDDYKIDIPELPLQAQTVQEEKISKALEEMLPSINSFSDNYNFDFSRQCIDCPFYIAELHTIEKNERAANSLKRCEKIPILIADLLRNHLSWNRYNHRICVFKGVRIGDNYLEKALIYGAALHDAHYYVVDDTASIIEKTSVSDELVDEIYFKITSKYSGYIIVYGGILF